MNERDFDVVSIVEHIVLMVLGVSDVDIEKLVDGHSETMIAKHWGAVE